MCDSSLVCSLEATFDNFAIALYLGLISMCFRSRNLDVIMKYCSRVSHGTDTTFTQWIDQIVHDEVDKEQKCCNQQPQWHRFTPELGPGLELRRSKRSIYDDLLRDLLELPNLLRAEAIPRTRWKVRSPSAVAPVDPVVVESLVALPMAVGLVGAGGTGIGAWSRSVLTASRWSLPTVEFWISAKFKWIPARRALIKIGMYAPNSSKSARDRPRISSYRLSDIGMHCLADLPCKMQISKGYQ